LDSSTVVCVTADLTRRGIISPSTLHTVSYVSGQSPEWDEVRFRRAVQDRYSIQQTTINLDDLPYLPLPYDAIVDGPHACQREVFRSMQAANARLLLSGRLGDTIFGNVQDSIGVLTDLVAGGDLRGYVREAVRACSATRRSLWSVLVDSLVPLGPAAFERGRAWRALTARFGGEAGSWSDRVGVAYGLLPAHMPRLEETWLWHTPRATRTGGLRGRELRGTMHRYVLEGRLVNRPGTLAYGVSHPFSHRPLVEFVLGIPRTELARPGEPRRLMRRAMADVLPEQIVKRSSKGYARPAMLRLLRPSIRQMLSETQPFELERLGILDPAITRARLDLVNSGAAGLLWNLTRVIAVERWLRVQHGRLDGLLDDVRLWIPAHIPQRKEVNRDAVRSPEARAGR
jgi:asparagine synthase (glutamine-hydrolysing)